MDKPAGIQEQNGFHDGEIQSKHFVRNCEVTACRYLAVGSPGGEGSHFSGVLMEPARKPTGQLPVHTMPPLGL